jgi:hypothetical protein
MIMRATLIAVMYIACVLAACTEKVKDVSGDRKYKSLIGAEYEIVGPVEAYGIRYHSKASVDSVTLVPPPGYDSFEVGFRVPIALGSKITIRQVLKTNRVFDPPMRFVVQLEGTQLPVDVPISMDIYGGNKGNADVDLNPSIYRPLPARISNKL